MDINDLTRQVIGAAMDVHRGLGPGLLESAYQECLVYEVRQRGLLVEEQVPLPLIYKGHRLNCSYRLDLIVEQRVIVEIKVVQRIESVHMAQLLTYLKLSGCQLGLLLNFQVPLMKDGVRRIVSGLPESRPPTQRDAGRSYTRRSDPPS